MDTVALLSIRLHSAKLHLNVCPGRCTNWACIKHARLHERAKNAETVAAPLINYAEADFIMNGAGQVKVIKCIVADFSRDEAAEA